MTWRIACADDIGGRAEQQDRVAIFQDGDVALIVLADGLGGHAGGGQAAGAAVDAARDVWRRQAHPAGDPKRLLSEVCDAAHGSINALRGAALGDPRSTFVVLYVDDRTAAWAHIGDSRLYHFGGLDLKSRTRDHSMVQLLVDMDEAREDEMATHPDQSQLLQSLGGDDTPTPDFAFHPLAAGDGFVLASDGLWETVDRGEMARALAEADLAVAAQQLVDRAVRRSGSGGDNVSVALARYDGAGVAARPGVPRGGLGLPTWLVLVAGIAAALAFALFVRSPADDPAPPPSPSAPKKAGEMPAPADRPKPAPVADQPGTQAEPE